MASIIVLFTCHGSCGLQRVKTLVPARGPNQDIAAWMQVVAAKCGEKHSFLAPSCTEGKIDLAIPVSPTAKIGEDAPALPETFSPDFMKSKGAN